MNKYEIRWYNYCAQEDQTVYILAKSKWDALRVFYTHKGNRDRYKSLVERVCRYYEPKFMTMEEALERKGRRNK